MRSAAFLILSAMVLLVFSCVKPPEYSIVPRVEFVSVNQNTFDELDPTPLQVQIYFEDGDGDIGSDDSINMYWEDSRVPGFPIEFKIPTIELQGNSKAISGTITTEYPISFCLNGTGAAQDTFYFRFYIIDRAGHVSNIDSTSLLYINCN